MIPIVIVFVYMTQRRDRDRHVVTEFNFIGQDTDGWELEQG